MKLTLEFCRAGIAITADWEMRPASAADVEAVAGLRAVVLRADLERLGRYDERRVRLRLRDGFIAAQDGFHASTATVHVDRLLNGAGLLGPGHHLAVVPGLGPGRGRAVGRGSTGLDGPV